MTSTALRSFWGTYFGTSSLTRCLTLCIPLHVFPAQDQYNRLVSDAFESQDRYGSGRLDKKRTQSAIEQVITSNKKISETFDNQWSALQNGSSSRTYRVRLVEFKKLMEGLLLELLKR